MPSSVEGYKPRPRSKYTGSNIARSPIGATALAKRKAEDAMSYSKLTAHDRKPPHDSIGVEGHVTPRK